MADSKAKNEIKAGIVILVAIVVLVGFLISINRIGEWFIPPKYFLIRFDNVTGLTPDSQVFYHGVFLGRTKAIKSAAMEVDGEKAVKALVAVRVLNGSIAIRSKDTAMVQVNLTGVSQIEIESSAEGKPLELFTTDPAKKSGQELAAIAQKYGYIVGPGVTTLPEIQAKIADVLDKINKVLSSENVENLKQILANVKNSSVELEKLSKETAQLIENVDPQIKDTIKNIQEISENANKFLKERSEAINKTMDDIQSAVSDAAKLIRDNSENITASISNFKTFSEQLVSTTESAKEKVAALLDKAIATVETSQVSIQEVLDTSANAMANFEEAAERIRRAPWLLLYQPKKGELDFQNLYDASRNIAATMQKLNNAVAKAQNISAENAQLRQEILQQLEDLMKELNEQNKEIHKRLKDSI